jgi:hypothetical protein
MIKQTSWILSKRRNYKKCKKCNDIIINRRKHSEYCLKCLKIMPREYYKKKLLQKKKTKEKLRLYCKKCNYSWIPRVNKPKTCPNCNCYGWEKKTRSERLKESLNKMVLLVS